jgi:hypothetical protein
MDEIGVIGGLPSVAIVSGEISWVPDKVIFSGVVRVAVYRYFVRKYRILSS